MNAPTTPPTLDQVERLAIIAGDADWLKRHFAAHPVWEEAIRRAVETLHNVAESADTEYGYGVYAEREGEAVTQ